MSGTTRSSANLDPRRRRLMFQAWHRGMREMDLIFGTFCDAEIEALSESELGDLERLMEVSDPELYIWFSDIADIAPTDYQTPVFRKIRAFHAAPKDL